MPKKVQKVIVAEENEESSSDHIGSATDEENESEAGESEVEDSAEAEDNDDDEDEDEDEEVEGAEQDDDEEEAVEGEEQDDDDDDDDDEEGEDDEADAAEVSAEDDDNEDEEAAQGSDDNQMEVDADEDDDDEEESDDKEKKSEDDKEKVKKKKLTKQETPNESEKSDKVEAELEELKKTYHDRMGLQLFIKFLVPHTVESIEEKAKSLSPLIVKVNIPRQYHPQFCLVDFLNKEDREKTLEQLLLVSKDKNFFVSRPRYEDEGYLEQLAAERVQRPKTFGEKWNRFRGSGPNDKYTSALVVYNIPKTASCAQISELFPGAVNIKIRPDRFRADFCSAFISCKSTHEAGVIQRQKLALEGKNLVIHFYTPGYKKKTNFLYRKAAGKKNGPFPKPPNSNEGQNESPKKASEPAQENEQTPKQPKALPAKKRLNEGDGESQVPAKKTKSTGEATPTAKTPQKKEKQPLNGNTKQVKAKAGAQKTPNANGTSQQKKDAPVVKQKVPGKKQAPKATAKKAKAVAN